jgi:CheY-like chemotaxis protein
MAILADESQPLPALVLLDLNLPIHSGLDILRWIRAQPRLKDLPVYVYSASIRTQDAERAKEAGATEYLVKPAGTDELVKMAARLKALLG